ncbi:unnamed protein product [Toxocara canis]|uniref:Uncharacterized protein n=1 Tax=Toxocara canis TaxID=6265 RepID=A0A3P7F7M6_TOXCA|nr:unnamed protein product [Toxocara canis]
MNFGRKDSARKYGPPMIKLNINSTIISADYRPQIDVLYIYTEGRTYLLRGASTNLGELEETAADRIRLIASTAWWCMRLSKMPHFKCGATTWDAISRQHSQHVRPTSNLLAVISPSATKQKAQISAPN